MYFDDLMMFDEDNGTGIPFPTAGEEHVVMETVLLKSVMIKDVFQVSSEGRGHAWLHNVMVTGPDQSAVTSVAMDIIPLKSSIIHECVSHLCGGKNKC